MPANAAAWYMAKRKFYMNQSFDQQLLPFLLKKYPEKFKVIGSSVVFLEVYKKDVAEAKLSVLVVLAKGVDEALVADEEAEVVAAGHPLDLDRVTEGHLDRIAHFLACHREGPGKGIT